jgi:crotonobetainyl-CoA:carnitine CoA-transferase CaiB-like acyl-CoA transferase
VTGPLSGVRVLEIADGIAGPYGGLLLADLGAEVVKLESPPGDRSRNWRDGESLTYQLLNRGKRGVTVDLDRVGADEVVTQLADASDVILLDTDAIQAWPYLNAILDSPERIVCRISLFGADGPMGSMPISELAAQLLSEATASVGDVDSGPGRAGVDIGSCYAGIYAAQAICATLATCDPGAGELIDVSLVGALLTMRSTLWVALSNPDEWWGFHLESYKRPPYRGYECADGRIYFDLRHSPSVDWDALLDELDLGDVRDDPRYPDLMVLGAGPGARYADIAQPVWERAFRERTVAEVDAIITKFGGDVFAVNTYPELLATPQVAAVGNVVPASADVPAHIRPPWRFSATPVGSSGPAPVLGASPRPILTECGASEEEIAAWVAAKLFD